MNEAVKLLLSLSLSGTILAVVLFILKPLVKHRFSRTIQYYIWLVVLIRLLLPISFEASVMNGLFYRNEVSEITTIDLKAPLASGADQGGSLSGIMPSMGVKGNVDHRVYQYDSDHSHYFRDLVNQYIIAIWLLGVIIALSINLVGYARFIRILNNGNHPATKSDEGLLVNLLGGQGRIRLFRNRLITTPTLIGLVRPRIIIPDIQYSEKQLAYILQHEIVHFRRLDIGVKWLMMMATAIHWFNPFMYMIKREVNRACELACDEAVIRNLSPAEKQAYGDTLISVASEPKYLAGALQATMVEEKQTLKERLVAIMKHNKRSKWITVLSGVLLICVVGGAIYLGAGTGTLGDKDVLPEPPISDGELGSPADEGDAASVISYDLVEISQFKTPYIGNHMKVGGIAGRLPIPDQRFINQYISLETSERPYKLTIYHELPAGATYVGEWPIETLDASFEEVLSSNALVAFSMIDNMDELTFAYRNSQSTNGLDKTKYDTAFSFFRGDFEEQYGDLTVLGQNIERLRETLEERAKDGNEGEVGGGQAVDEISQLTVAEQKRADLYVAVMKEAFYKENGGDGFVAVKLDTFDGLSDVAKEEVLKLLSDLFPHIYDFERVKDDQSKFKFDSNMMLETIDGSLLWVKVTDYSEDKATITGISWFGNLAANFLTYEANFKNGTWQLELIGMAES